MDFIKNCFLFLFDTATVISDHYDKVQLWVCTRDWTRPVTLYWYRRTSRNANTLTIEQVQPLLPTFLSILVLTRPGIEPATSQSTSRRSPDWAM